MNFCVCAYVGSWMCRYAPVEDNLEYHFSGSHTSSKLAKKAKLTSSEPRLSTFLGLLSTETVSMYHHVHFGEGGVVYSFVCLFLGSFWKLNLGPDACSPALH